MSPIKTAWLLSLSLIFGGCCGNVICLETIFRRVPSSSYLLTLAQFLFVTIMGLSDIVSYGPPIEKDAARCCDPATHICLPATVLRCRCSSLPFAARLHWKRSPFPPLRNIVTVLLFFISNTAINVALGLDVPMPVHIIFRSASLIASSILNIIILKRRYPFLCYVALVLVSIGVFFSTYSSSANHSQNGSLVLSKFLAGIGLLTFSLILSCILGIYQEETFRLYGAHWREALFYSHLYALPLFLLAMPQISGDVKTFSNTPLIFGIPQGWLYLMINTFSQYICVSAVHRLASFTTSLTINLVLTVRKFVSLVISVIFFDSSLAIKHIIGGMFVFLGTLLYGMSLNASKAVKKHTQSVNNDPKKTLKKNIVDDGDLNGDVDVDVDKAAESALKSMKVKKG